MKTLLIAFSFLLSFGVCAQLTTVRMSKDGKKHTDTTVRPAGGISIVNDTLLVTGYKSFTTTANLRASNFHTTPGNLIAEDLSLNGADFVWNPSSTAADDGFFIIRPTGIAPGSPGRWEKMFKGRTRIAEAGIKTDGTNQITALNTLLGNGTVKEIVIDAGTVSFDGKLTVPRGKKIIFQNGAKITGLAGGAPDTLAAEFVECDYNQQSFSNVVVTGLLNTEISVKWWGALGNGTGDDAPAFNAAIRATRYIGRSAPGLKYSGATVLVPPGAYYTNSTILLCRGIRLKGVSPVTTGAGRMHGQSVIMPASGIHGITIWNAYLCDANGIDGDGSGSSVEDLHIIARGQTTGVHGIWMLATASVKSCRIREFSNYGIKIGDATWNKTNYNWNANHWLVEGCWIETNYRDGLVVEGWNGNAGLCTGTAFMSNGLAGAGTGYGFKDISYFGNTYLGNTCEGNSQGAFYCADNSSMVLGCYTEGDQPPAHVERRTWVSGGTHGAGFTSTSTGTIFSDGYLANLKVKADGYYSFGPVVGASGDGFHRDGITGRIQVRHGGQGWKNIPVLYNAVDGEGKALFSDVLEAMPNVTIGPSNAEVIRLALRQSITGGANLYLGGSGAAGGNATTPKILFGDNFRAYAGIYGNQTQGTSTNNVGGGIDFMVTDNVSANALALALRIRHNKKIYIPDLNDGSGVDKILVVNNGELKIGNAASGKTNTGEKIGAGKGPTFKKKSGMAFWFKTIAHTGTAVANTGEVVVANSAYDYYHAAYNTTSGAVMTNMVTLSDLPETCSGSVELTATGYSVDGSYGKSIIARFKKISGTLTLFTPTVTEAELNDGLTAADIDAVGQSNNIVLRAIGASGKNISWKFVYKINLVQPSF